MAPPTLLPRLPSSLPDLSPSPLPPHATLPLPPHDISSEDHAVLQSHYLRFQKTLLTAVDAHMADLDAQLRAKDHAVHMTEEEKKNVGVELWRCKKEIGNMNEGLGRIRSILQYSESNRKILESDREAAEREIARLMDNSKSLSSALTTTRTRLDGSATKLAQMNEVNAAYFSSIKIQRRVEEKLRKELDLEAERRKAGEVAAQEMEKKYEALVKTKKEMDDVLKGQRNETAMAQGAMNKMQREINELAASKKMLEKHWEDSLAAMAKRDQSFQHVETSKQSLASRLLEAENTLRVLRIEKADAEKAAREKDLENTGLQDNLKQLRGNISSADRTGRDTRNELVEAQVAESLYRQELDKVTKSHELSKDELQRKSQTIAELKAQIADLKHDFSTRLQNETLSHVARKEEQIEARHAADIHTALAAAENTTVTLRHDNASLRLEFIALKETLKKALQEKQIVSERATALDRECGNLDVESKHIVYELEKKEHDVNALRAALVQSKHEDKTNAHQLEMQSMRSELREAKAENERLQNRWLTEKKQSLKRSARNEALEGDKVFLQTQLGITDTIRVKSEQEIAAAKKEAIDYKLESARLSTELKRLHPVLEEMRRKNVNLEKQLIESQFALQEAGATQATQIAMLKAEIRRLYAARADVRQARIADERSAHGLERKYVLAREMVDSLRAERNDLRRKEADLTRRLEEGERRWVDARAAVAAAEREAQKSNNRTPPERKSLLWKSLASTPAGENQSRDPPPTGSGVIVSPPAVDVRPLMNDVPDLEAWRLKIDTLTTEKAFLQQENKMLARKLEQATGSTNRVGGARASVGAGGPRTVVA
ncbi:hypothetical protein HDU87_000419 [Geranomyces variabilis]|uniref:Uncharacterized protein n=1 Tax=Geranomyces variabilis TaxID=109894 RepID=A0AAD5TNI8_9FUNG|nr:hypothetical protein HDU87_000419 [Geranomyces variabilis]